MTFIRFRKYDLVKFMTKNLLTLKSKKSINQTNTDESGTKYIACFDEIFDIVREAHNKETLHAAGEITWRAVTKKWKNISRVLCTLYVSMCPICISRIRVPKRPRGISK